MTELYRNSGLRIYEKSHYSHGEHIAEVEQMLAWYLPRNTGMLDIGCSGGLHALELARRGFSVTGIDIEPSAIELAIERVKDENLKARFFVMDIEKDDISRLGKFDLIYSIGNVLSHVKKDRIPDVMRKINGCLDKNGIFLFDVLINAKPFQEKIRPGEKDLQIIWKRKINEKTGRISMDGIFLDFCFIQHFEVWGYTIEEMTDLLNLSKFRDIGFCGKLDFSMEDKTKNPISLYFRCKSGE